MIRANAAPSKMLEHRESSSTSVSAGGMANFLGQVGQSAELIEVGGKKINQENRPCQQQHSAYVAVAVKPAVHLDYAFQQAGNLARGNPAVARLLACSSQAGCNTSAAPA